MPVVFFTDGDPSPPPPATHRKVNTGIAVFLYLYSSLYCMPMDRECTVCEVCTHGCTHTESSTNILHFQHFLSCTFQIATSSKSALYKLPVIVAKNYFNIFCQILNNSAETIAKTLVYHSTRNLSIDFELSSSSF
jgi:hypothetical protein